MDSTDNSNTDTKRTAVFVDFSTDLETYEKLQLFAEYLEILTKMKVSLPTALKVAFKDHEIYESLKTRGT